MTASKNPNRPAPGSSIKVEPIRSKRAISNIKKILVDQPRNLCLFTLGINTAWRANELISITVGQVKHLTPGDTLELKQSKNQRYRATPLNATAIQSIQAWLSHPGAPQNDAQALFTGQRGALTVETVSRLVKQWCRETGLKGNYASHSLRKTWGYWQRIGRGTSVALLMHAYGHSSEKQTLEYLGIQAEEITEIYDMEL